MIATAEPIAPDASWQAVSDILDRHGRQAARLVPILQAVQETYRFLPPDVLSYVADALEVPAARVFGVATFYAHFAVEPKGKHLIRLCDGTACHVKASLPILRAIRERLGLDETRVTTADMLFTVETVACLGACGLAPVVVVNEAVHGQMTPEGAVKLVEGLIAQEAAT